ncbi:calcium-binding protein [Kribbella sp. NBC_01505]|uniref:calcium-binding protein n=1 Tax=Kribbella sp. NBC_01505 TaxID=2903580 RepID=UPI003863290D
MRLSQHKGPVLERAGLRKSLRLATCVALLIPAVLAATSGGVANAAITATVVEFNPSLGTLTVTAQAGRTNFITVSQRQGQLVVDDLAGVSAAPPCIQLRQDAVGCPVKGIRSVVVDAGDLSDVVRFNAAGQGDVLTATIHGGAGDDLLVLDQLATSGKLFGGPGSDELRGGKGDDLLSGGAGADDLQGADGADLADYAERDIRVLVRIDDLPNDGTSGEGDNVHTDVENLSGGSSDDALEGSSRNNTLDGGPGRDSLVGGDGNDSLAGGQGEDFLDGGQNSDNLFGGDGNDRLEGGPDRGSDFFDGGDGEDIASYLGRVDDILADNDGEFDDGSGLDGELDNVRPSVESIFGGEGNDRLSVAAPDSALVRNILRGAGGNDRLIVEDNGLHDIADGGPGANSCFVDTGEETVNCQLIVSSLRRP